MVNNTFSKKIVEKPRGGNGSLEIYELLPQDKLLGHMSLLAKVELHPRSSIGLHRHVGETELYYVIKGTGFFLDNDGSRVPVKPGDVCAIDVGGQHGMDNPTDEPMEILAIVYPE